MKIIRICSKIITFCSQVLCVLIFFGLVLLCWSTWARVNPLLEDAGGGSGEPVPGDLYYRAPTLTPYRIFIPSIGVLPTIAPLLTPVPTPKPTYPTEDEGLPMCRRFCTALKATKLHWHGNPMICECYYEFKGVWAWRIVWMDRRE